MPAKRIGAVPCYQGQTRMRGKILVWTETLDDKRFVSLSVTPSPRMTLANARELATALIQAVES